MNFIMASNFKEIRESLSDLKGTLGQKFYMA